MTDPNGSPNNSTDAMSPEIIMKALEVHAQNSKVWPPNQQLDGGNYTIIKPLGQGGFGITYLATDNDQKRLVVIKTLNQKVQQHQLFNKLRNDFLNEALRLSAFKHPHIVQVYKLIQEDDLPCIIMEYIQGQDLDKLTQQHPLSIQKALQYIQQIGEALKEVHRNGLLHRDVKPSNIIIREDGENAVLIDFGIARQFTPDDPKTLTAFSSGGFTPCEQERPGIINSKPGFYTDVYALAATLYHLLTKQVPVDALTRFLEVKNNNKDSLISPKKLNPKISQKLEEAILTGMAVYPKDRPQTVDEWLGLLPDLSELEELDNSEIYSTLEVTKPESTQEKPISATTQVSNPDNQPIKTKNFNKVWVGSLGILGVCTVVGIAVFSWQYLPVKTIKQCIENKAVCFNTPENWSLKTSESNPFNYTIAEIVPKDTAVKSKIIIESEDVTDGKILEHYQADRIADIKKYSSQILQEDKVKIKDYSAYKLVYEKEDNQKVMQIGLISKDQVYVLSYESSKPSYDQFKPTAEQIINSLEISP